ncbi:ankyrin repeat domain-containing protein [Candidatus Sumerlaeota bacterium]|nr:ankyrin repeat domain-containing protein [Candidatus Sumerlaeota bacterium]
MTHLAAGLTPLLSIQGAFENVPEMAMFVVGAGLLGFAVLFFFGPKIRAYLAGGIGMSAGELSKCKKCGRLTPVGVKICKDCAAGRTPSNDQTGQQPRPAAAKPVMREPLPDIILAVQSGNATLARQLIERDIDLEATDDNDYAALHHAAVAGNIELARLLLDGGANVNNGVAFNKSPYQLAKASGQAEMAKFLASRGGR